MTEPVGERLPSDEKPPVQPAPVPHSGEGAATALQVLVRTRLAPRPQDAPAGRIGLTRGIA
jgi:hypothetical protein